MRTTKYVFAIDQPFGRWTVCGPKTNRGTAPAYPCRCECGTERIVLAADLASGRSTNCGCVRIRKVASRNASHGKTHTREYVVWCGMIARCHNPNHVSFHRYGGRGVAVCDRWRASFGDFIKDMGSPESDGLTIDRIENDRGYEPGNCRWVTNLVNARNRPGVHRITIDGVTKTLTEWAEQYGIRRRTANKRIERGMDPVAAVTAPLMTRSECQRLSVDKRLNSHR